MYTTATRLSTLQEQHYSIQTYTTSKHTNSTNVYAFPELFIYMCMHCKNRLWFFNHACMLYNVFNCAVLLSVIYTCKL